MPSQSAFGPTAPPEGRAEYWSRYAAISPGVRRTSVLRRKTLVKGQFTCPETNPIGGPRRSPAKRVRWGRKEVTLMGRPKKYTAASLKRGVAAYFNSIRYERAVVYN